MFRQPAQTTLNNVLFGYQVSTSLVGRVIPILYGQRRMAGNVTWVGNWIAQPVTGGKGNKGKNGNQQYNYIADLMIGLCKGPVPGIFSIWNNKDEYNLTDSTEVFTVPGGGGSYTATYGGTGHPFWWVLNISVSRADTISFTANDYGSPGSVSKTVAVQTPMVLVASSPGAGQYTLSTDSSGFAHYGFSAADAGKIITITYSYQINNYSIQGSPVTHLNLVLFPGYLGQAPWGYLNTVAALQSQSIGYSELAYLASYAFILGSSGVLPNLNFEVRARCGWGGHDAAGNPIVDCNPADVLTDMLTNPLDGILGWATSVGSATGYGLVQISGLATITGNAMVVTTGALTGLAVGGQINVGGVGLTATAIPDSTHATLSSSPGDGTGIPWVALVPGTYNLVTGSSQWLPSTSVTYGLGAASEIYTYCAANGLFISPLLDQQQEARSILNDILLMANGDAFFSEGLLKFRSYGDTTAAGNGFQFSPNTQPVYDITDAHLLCGPGEEPVREKRKDVRDIKNEVTVEFVNRGASYAVNTFPLQNMALVNQNGRRPADTKKLNGLCEQIVAGLVANNLLKRECYINGGNEYEITLGAEFELLEPMDIITLTEAYVGMNKRPMRITKIEETDNLRFNVTLETFPWSVTTPTLYPNQGHGPTSTGFYIDPGLVNNPVFVPIPRQNNQGSGYTLGIALSGGQNWGGAAVYVSTDGGDSYELDGVQNGASVMGVLSAPLPAQSDPDTVNTLSVNLIESYGQLPSFSQAQADAGVSLCLVDNEYISFETATLTGTSQYNLTYIRRGLFGSAISAHAIGAPFVMIESQLYRYNYPASSIGKTLYFKFASMNLAGQRQQDISQMTAWPYFLVGPRVPYPLNAGWEAPIPGDALWTSENMGVFVEYTKQENGILQATAQMLVNPPLNAFSTLTGIPAITTVTAAITAGGTIDGGHTYYLQMFAYDAATNPNQGQGSPIFPITVPAGTGYKLTITITWPAGSYGGALYVGTDSLDEGLQLETSFGAGSSTGGTTVAYTLSSILGEFIGVPDPSYDHTDYVVREDIHAGIWGAPVTAAPTSLGGGTGVLQFAGLGGSPGDWVGRVVSMLARGLTAAQDPTHRIPIADFLVTAYPGGDNLTVSPDPTTALGGGSVLQGDVFTMRLGRNSTGRFSTILDGAGICIGFIDLDWVNNLEGGTGLPVNSLVNSLALIINGPGVGQPPQTIVSNTSNQINVSPGWSVAPTNASVIVILSAQSATTRLGSIQLLNYSGTGQPDEVPVSNEEGFTAFIEGCPADVDDVTAPEQFARFREVYIWGAQGTANV